MLSTLSQVLVDGQRPCKNRFKSLSNNLMLLLHNGIIVTPPSVGFCLCCVVCVVGLPARTQ